MALTAAEKKRRQRERDAVNGFEHISLKVRREHKDVLLGIVSVLNEGDKESCVLLHNGQLKEDAMNEIDTRDAVAVRVSRTDWNRIQSMTDDDIDRAIASDPDAAPVLTSEQMTEFKLTPPRIIK